MDTGATRRRGRAAAVVGLIAAAVVPLAGAAASVWTTTGADLASVRAERRGSLYLGETVKLLVVVADAQSSAVHGTAPNPADIAKAVDAVDRSGLAQDPDPGTGTLWAQIRPQILALSKSGALGAGAYQVYSQATDLLLQQITAIDDASGLVLDPGADAYHLVDALTLRLPDMAVEAGRFDDLVTLAGRAGTRPAEAQTASTARIAVVRDRIAVDAHAFSTALNKVFRSTESATLGAHLLGDVDLVNTDVNALAPTASVIDGALVVPAADTVSADRQAFDPAVLVLETAGLTELDVLLKARESAYEQRRLDVLALTIGGATVALPSAWWLRRRRAGAAWRGGEAEAEDREPRSTARIGRRYPLRGLPAARRKTREELGDGVAAPRHQDRDRDAVFGSAHAGGAISQHGDREPDTVPGPDPAASDSPVSATTLPTRPAGGPARVGREFGPEAADRRGP